MTCQRTRGCSQENLRRNIIRSEPRGTASRPWLLRDWQPDLILLDVMMPGMDGYECCRQLKEETATLHIPVVMVTALGESGERLRGLEAGADDFLTKPVDYDTLMVRV